MTERYNGANRLRRLHGMRGYGIYCRVVELCASAPGKKLRYDLDDLVFDMREKRELVKEIVEEFGLFVIVGEYIEDVYARSPEALERERQELIRANRSAGAKKAAQTRRENREAARQAEANPENNANNAPPANNANDGAKSEPTPVPTPTYANAARQPQPSAAKTSPSENVAANRSPIAVRFDKIIATWNDVFKGTRRMMHNRVPDEVTWQNFVDSESFYTDQDYLEAFERARSDKKFMWQFRDALKPSNMQRLLSEVEAKKLREKEEEEKLDPATKEMMEYGRKMGWNWTQTK